MIPQALNSRLCGNDREENGNLWFKRVSPEANSYKLMIYFLYGTDTDNARAKARELLTCLQKKKPDTLVFRVDAEKWNEIHLEELVGGQGLFSQKLLIFADRLFENEEAREAVEKNLEEIGKSDNIFIFLEEKVAKVLLLDITEVAERVQSFEKMKGKEKQEFNIFSLTDAFGRRDKKKLWVLYQKALQTDAVPEEIHGILFWQLKSMLVAAHSTNSGQAGLAPFVFTKAKNFLKNYSVPELQTLSSTLVRMYHDAHRGVHDFPVALERFILTL